MGFDYLLADTIKIRILLNSIWTVQIFIRNYGNNLLHSIEMKKSYNPKKVIFPALSINVIRIYLKCQVFIVTIMEVILILRLPIFTYIIIIVGIIMIVTFYNFALLMDFNLICLLLLCGCCFPFLFSFYMGKCQNMLQWWWWQRPMARVEKNVEKKE